MNYAQKRAHEFAASIKSLGFRVFLAKSETHGFFTDEKGERVVSFSFTDGESLSGNYGPPSRESGTGWRLEHTPAQLRTKEDVAEALYEIPPVYCGPGWRHYTNITQYLEMYGSSSGYKEL